MIHSKTWPRLIIAAALMAAACAPDEDPVSTRIPPRDADGAELRTVTLVADSLETKSYQHDPNFSVADRVLFGSWEGVRATALIRFDRDAFVVFEDDTLAGSTVFDSELSFNCVEGQGADQLDVMIRAVSAGKENEWEEGDVAYPGPAIDAAPSTEETVENCELEDDFPEQTYTLPDAIIESWIADSTSNNGFALTSLSDAILQFASSENNIVEIDSGGVVTVSGPRLRFRAILPGGDTTSVFLSESEILGDDYIVSPDSAMLPCADAADCLSLAQGLTQRILVRPALVDLPLGSNVHRAVLRLNVLGHPRFDRDLDLQVLRLTSEFPDDAPVDSLVTTSGTIWHEGAVATTDMVVEVPITELIQAWYDGAFVNEGFLLRIRDEDRGVTTVSFASSSHPDPALRPTIEIDYTTPLGGRP